MLKVQWTLADLFCSPVVNLDTFFIHVIRAPRRLF
jgi:hypothetical protein